MLLQFLFYLAIPFKNSNTILNTPSSEKVSYSCVELNSIFEKTDEINQNKKLEKDRILYYDEDLIFVNKPSNLQTVPGFQDKHSLATMVQKLFKIDRLEHMSPHRLDLQTSGVGRKSTFIFFVT